MPNNLSLPWERELSNLYNYYKMDSGLRRNDKPHKPFFSRMAINKIRNGMDIAVLVARSNLNWWTGKKNEAENLSADGLNRGIIRYTAFRSEYGGYGGMRGRLHLWHSHRPNFVRFHSGIQESQKHVSPGGSLFRLNPGARICCQPTDDLAHSVLRLKDNGTRIDAAVIFRSRLRLSYQRIKLFLGDKGTKIPVHQPLIPQFELIPILLSPKA